MNTDITRWLASCASPLASLKPNPSYADLLPLKAVFQNVRVVGLGEATHGSSEFFTMKHRFVQFLVEELGFTMFAIEASLTASRALNTYVLNGVGDPKELLRGLGFWTWNTVEVLQLVEWLRDYNDTVSPDRRVHFVGFDIQGAFSAAQDLLIFLSEVAPESSAEVEGTLHNAMLDLPPGNPSSSEDQQHKQQVLNSLLGIIGFISFHRFAFAQKTSPEAVEEALTLARNLTRSYDAYAKPWIGRTEKRDAYMADTINEQLTASGNEAKMIVWAHNGHLSTQGFGGHASMGTHLRARFGDQYYVVGFAFNRGSFWAKAGPGGPLTRFTMGPAPAEFFEGYCAAAGLGNSFIQLGGALRNPGVQSWVGNPVPMRNTGAVVFAQNPEIASSVLLDSYNAFVYVTETTCAQPSL